ncbi:MAG: type II toxin-antitoxin system RelE/ParE family toxin [Bacteroidetes bacterium]|nr:type II toxin-antitoxin system RelE/ParE family toxin [Bacteroidota bacterium]
MISVNVRQHKGLHFEKLKGDRKGEYSIKLNKQYRLIFEQIKSEEQKAIMTVLLINEISKHYE